MKKFLKENKKGFTLIELLVVIAILAVLATLYVPKIIASSKDAKNTVEIANARTLASEITIYNLSQTSDTAWIQGTDSTTLTGKTVVKSSDITDASGLLEGRTFPDSSVVLIVINNSTGSAYIVKPDGTAFSSSTPTPTP